MFVIVAVVVAFLATIYSKTIIVPGETSALVVASLQERAYGRVIGALALNTLLMAVPVAYALSLIGRLLAS